MAQQKIISQAQIVTQAFTNDVDTALIPDGVILGAQKAYLKPVLGEDFYDDILDKVSLDTSGDLSSDEWTLVDDYIRPMMAFYVKGDIIPDLVANQTSQGVVTNNPEFAVPTPKHHVEGLQDAAYKTAGRLQEVLVDYMEDNNTFSLWSKGDNKTRHSRNVGGWHITKRHDDTNVFEDTGLNDPNDGE